MAEQVFPTKGNLINTKKSLALAKVGFELLDRKRNIIVREMMTLIDRASAIDLRAGLSRPAAGQRGPRHL